MNKQKVPVFKAPVCLHMGVALVCVLIVGFAPQRSSAADIDWTVAPYLWLPGVELDAGVNDIPIIGADVRMLAFKGFSLAVGLATTDRSGRYALSFSTEGIGCREDALVLTINVGVNAEFASLNLSGNSGVRCTDKPQTLDFQLERRPT